MTRLRPLFVLLLAASPLTAQDAPAAAPAWAATLDSAVAAEMARTKTPGFQIAVVVDGKLAYTKGYGVADIETGRATTDRTLFRVGSVTKQFTATAILKLEQDGKLRVEWTDRDGEGYAELDFSPDFRSFDGFWASYDSPNGAPWNGVKQ